MDTLVTLRRPIKDVTRVHKVKLLKGKKLLPLSPGKRSRSPKESQPERASPVPQHVSFVSLCQDLWHHDHEFSETAISYPNRGFVAAPARRGARASASTVTVLRGLGAGAGAGDAARAHIVLELDY